MAQRFEITPVTEVITEFALALTTHRAGRWQPIGTAVAIAPNLILTAKHVVKDIWEPHHLRRPEKTADSPIVAFQVLPGAVGALWYAKNAYFSLHTDLVLLDVFPYSESATNYRWRKVVMNFAPPDLGQTILGFGYSGGSIDEIDDETLRLRWDTRPRTTQGKVTAIHPVRRDQGLFNFPCFEMSAHTERGMSGGPLFDENGRLCGLVCGGGLDREDGTAIRYGTLLWPLLLIKEINGKFEGEAERLFTFYELVSRGAVAAVGLDAFQIQELGGGDLSVGLRAEVAGCHC
jgi:hypothetical protein